jgi:2-polyprenyl-3-methyl-5-hydroxy-6-metoxy-1,4-benzoquinol methylase
MSEQKPTTVERLYSKYHSFNRRTTIEDPRLREVSFRSMRRSLAGWFPADKSTVILDIACGEGALLAFLKAEGYTNLSGFDLSPENVAICHRLGLPFVEQADALEQIGAEPQRSFGLIFAIDLVEHLPKEKAAGFIEAARGALAQGGTLVLQTPNAGSLYGCYNRYYDLSHEFAVTEKSAVDLLMLGGFSADEIEVRPQWSATTCLGRLREIHLALFHWLIFLGEGSRRPRIPTGNLMIRGTRRSA